MPYRVVTCSRCDAIVDPSDPNPHGPEDEVCYGEDRDVVELFTQREVDHAVREALEHLRIPSAARRDPVRTQPRR